MTKHALCTTERFCLLGWCSHTSCCSSTHPDGQTERHRTTSDCVLDAVNVPLMNTGFIKFYWIESVPMDYRFYLDAEATNVLVRNQSATRTMRDRKEKLIPVDTALYNALLGWKSLAKIGWSKPLRRWSWAMWKLMELCFTYLFSQIIENLQNEVQQLQNAQKDQNSSSEFAYARYKILENKLAKNKESKKKLAVSEVTIEEWLVYRLLTRQKYLLISVSCMLLQSENLGRILLKALLP